MRYLKRWQGLGLITGEQVAAIGGHMRAESHRQFLKLIKALFIIGAFWLVVSFVALLEILGFGFLEVAGRLILRLAGPLVAIAKRFSPERYRELLAGAGCFLGFGLMFWAAVRVRNRAKIATMQLGCFQERELSPATWLFTIAYILAAAAWQLFNYAAYPAQPHLYHGQEIFFPYVSCAAVVFFFAIAYAMRDQLALLFGIGFVAHAVGFFASYFFACYVIGVQMPVTQVFVGMLLLSAGLWHVGKARGREDRFGYLFGRTYEWTGLLFVYCSLWIMSIWGISFQKDFWAPPAAGELWIANGAFIAATLLALFYGALKEDRLFFNFGLTFFIIESYTLFFSHVWETLGAAIGSFLFGAMMIATGYVLRALWLKAKIFKKGP